YEMHGLVSTIVGGRPMRSKLSRRISVTRSASAEGVSFSASNFARTNRSMGFRGQLRFFTAGTAGRTAGLKAQCSFFDRAGVSSGCETTPAIADNAINTIPFTHVRV